MLLPLLLVGISNFATTLCGQNSWIFLARLRLFSGLSDWCINYLVILNVAFNCAWWWRWWWWWWDCVGVSGQLSTEHRWGSRKHQHQMKERKWCLRNSSQIKWRWVGGVRTVKELDLQLRLHRENTDWEQLKLNWAKIHSCLKENSA